jgi:hypothetical protein
MFSPLGTTESDTLTRLKHVNRQLSDLMTKLHSANEAMTEAAGPLDRLDELDSDQRKAVARQIRAAEQQWEQITQLIEQATAKASQLGRQPPASCPPDRAIRGECVR